MNLYRIEQANILRHFPWTTFIVVARAMPGHKPGNTKALHCDVIAWGMRDVGYTCHGVILHGSKSQWIDGLSRFINNEYFSHYKPISPRYSELLLLKSLPLP